MIGHRIIIDSMLFSCAGDNSDEKGSVLSSVWRSDLRRYCSADRMGRTPNSSLLSGHTSWQAQKRNDRTSTLQTESTRHVSIRRIEPGSGVMQKRGEQIPEMAERMAKQTMMTTTEIARIMTERGEPITASGVRFVIARALDKMRAAYALADEDGFPGETRRIVPHRRNRKRYRSC